MVLKVLELSLFVLCVVGGPKYYRPLERTYQSLVEGGVRTQVPGDFLGRASSEDETRLLENRHRAVSSGTLAAAAGACWKACAGAAGVAAG